METWEDDYGYSDRDEKPAACECVNPGQRSLPAKRRTAPAVDPENDERDGWDRDVCWSAMVDRICMGDVRERTDPNPDEGCIW